MEPALPQPDITHPLVRDLARGHAAVIPPGELLGFYLGGSLATGGFNPETSDLDFLAVTRSAITPGDFTSLAVMHRAIRNAGINQLYRNYEGIYLTVEQARKPRTGITAPHLGTDGHFALEKHGGELVIELNKVRHHGFVITGADPEELIGDVPAEDFRRAQAELFTGWWLPKLERRERMDAGYQAYAVMTMARMLYGITHGTDISKPDAADWLARVHPEYAELVRAALDWRPGRVLDRLDGVYELIRFTTARLDSGATD